MFEFQERYMWILLLCRYYLHSTADQVHCYCLREFSTMDKYSDLSRIGEGSFGRVYKATEIATKKTVALKVITKVNLIIF